MYTINVFVIKNYNITRTHFPLGLIFKKIKMFLKSLNYTIVPGLF